MARPRRTRKNRTNRSTGDYRHDTRRKNNPPASVFLVLEPGDHRRIAVKVIDQRGNEVMRVAKLS